MVRAQREGDRRTSIVSLTEQGRAQFATMAAAHEGWVNAAMADVTGPEAIQLSDFLKAFRSNWEADK